MLERANGKPARSSLGVLAGRTTMRCPCVGSPDRERNCGTELIAEADSGEAAVVAAVALRPISF